MADYIRRPCPDGICHIRSTLDDHGNAACLLEWGTLRTLLKPAAVLITARDLMAAATAAETDIALVETLRRDVRLDDQTLAALLAKVRARRAAPRGKTALRVMAVAGGKTGKPYVNIARGSMQAQMTPDRARAMAMHWVQAATAASIDVRLRYALGEWGRLDAVEIEELFALLEKTQGRDPEETPDA